MENILEQIGNMIKVQELHFSITNLKSLKTLYLNENSFLMGIPINISNLSNISDLDSATSSQWRFLLLPVIYLR